STPSSPSHRCQPKQNCASCGSSIPKGFGPPIDDSATKIPPIDLEELPIRVDMIGPGESYWQKVINAPDQFLQVLDIAWSMSSHSPAPAGRICPSDSRQG
ncbi:MAG: hypothetical protein JRJ68_11305, partial [Deltaproteobacteria bacterium]|nr:hypothetical protein [Deltaproteobacteria bacterium]